MKFHIVLLLLLIVGIFGCDITNKTEVEQSNITVQVVSPIVWEEFENDEMEVNLLVESEQEITSIDLFIDGALVLTIIDEPYQTTIPVADSGTHNFYAIATDVLDASQTSELVNFTIKIPDTEAPNGFITYPADWSEVSGTFDIIVSATDNVGVDNINFYIDGIVWENTSGSIDTFSLDSTLLINDNHTIFAKIYDANSNNSTTQLITVKVSN